MTAFDVRLFGRFQILLNGVEITPVSPQVAILFKMFGLRGPEIHPDELAQILWPGEPHTLIRKRLRNVTARARLETGAVIEGRRHAVILHDGVISDYAEFFATATRAISGVDGREPSSKLCLQALARWNGLPLEEHRVDAWAAPYRRRAIELQRRLWHGIDPADRGRDNPADAPEQ